MIAATPHDALELARRAATLERRLKRYEALAELRLAGWWRAGRPLVGRAYHRWLRAIRRRERTGSRLELLADELADLGVGYAVPRTAGADFEQVAVFEAAAAGRAS